MQQQQIQQPQTQAKQNNLIRKTAIQTFQPIITKMQQHIAYLLAQTTKLRQKNQLIQRTVMDHKVINNSIAQLREDMNKIEDKIINYNKEQKTQGINLKKQIVQITVDIERINSSLNSKQKLITQLFTKNSQQSSKIQLTSSQFKQLVQVQAQKLANLQANNTKLQHSFKNFEQQTTHEIKNITNILEQKQNKIQQNTQKLELYLNQRQQLRKIIQDIWKKVDDTIGIQRYEREWKIIRMENQAMKKQNKRMIDEALTPDVRKFLPEMMQRMEQVRKVNKLQIILNQQKQKSDKFQQIQNNTIAILQKQLSQAESRSQEIRAQLIEKTTKIATSLSSKMQEGKNDSSSAITTLQSQTLQLIAKKQQQIQQSIQSLIDRNHQKIYKLTVDLIPQQQKQFYNKMKQFLPLLESTKKQVLQRCDQITQFGKSLEQRLQGFNNRIVKIKGDMNVDVENLKKKNKSIDNSILIIADNFKNLGKIISAYCQMFLIQYSLSFDLVGKQIYVTYNDGIIYEDNENQGQVCYRKMKATKQQLRRSALAQLIKLTDSLVSSEEYQFMYIKQYKPSQHFKLIKQGVMLSCLNMGSVTSRKKQRKGSVKIRQLSVQNKLPSIDQNQSKTIELPAPNLDNSKQVFSNTLTTDFNNIRKKQRQRPYKGRYSQMK